MDSRGDQARFPRGGRPFRTPRILVIPTPVASAVSYYYGNDLSYLGHRIPGQPEKGITTMTRSRRNRMLSGVCAGIAEQVGIGTFWIRLLFVTAAVIIPGVSLIAVVTLYILMALVLPWDDEVARYR